MTQAAMAESWKERAERTYRSWMRWILRKVPAGWRSAVGVLLILGGLVGFLPVLGFWMIPLGVAVIAVDIVSLKRRLARRRNRRSSGQDDAEP